MNTSVICNHGPMESGIAAGIPPVVTGWPCYRVTIWLTTYVQAKIEINLKCGEWMGRVHNGAYVCQYSGIPPIVTGWTCYRGTIWWQHVQAVIEINLKFWFLHIISYIFWQILPISVEVPKMHSDSLHTHCRHDEHVHGVLEKFDAEKLPFDKNTAFWANWPLFFFFFFY